VPTSPPSWSPPTVPILSDRFRGERFVTALALQLDAASGRSQLISAGHPPVRLLRDGHVSTTRRRR